MPDAPAGYGLRSDSPLDWPELERRLTASRNYWVCTTRPDGRPHAMPVWGLWFEGALWFSTDPASRKARNLERQPAVVVHLESGDEVVVVEGSAQRFPAESLPDGWLDAYEEKYGFRPDPADEQGCFYRVPPVKLLSWDEADYPSSASRRLF